MRFTHQFTQTGALAVEAARRGARVTAVDVSPTLLDVARARTPDALDERIDYQAGDMLDAGARADARAMPTPHRWTNQ